MKKKLYVIASVAKQSKLSDCFVAMLLAMTFVSSNVFAENFSRDASKEAAKEVAVKEVKEAVQAVEVAVPAAQPVVVKKVEVALAPVKQVPVVEKKETAAPKKAAAVVETKAGQSPVAASSAEPEAFTKFKAIQAQEQRVVVLKKQLDGETSQLAEMRRSMAESFGLDAKKLESGAYNFDSKTGKFVEK